MQHPTVHTQCTYVCTNIRSIRIHITTCALHVHVFRARGRAGKQINAINQSTYVLMPQWCLVPTFIFTELINPQPLKLIIVGSALLSAAGEVANSIVHLTDPEWNPLNILH